MRSFFGYHNLFAVSANNKETALNTEQTLDTGMLVSVDSVMKYEARRETNQQEAMGKEEADTVYDLGALASMEINFPKMQAQHAAFLMAYALGLRSSAAAGSTGYKHTITPITGDLDATRSNPTFTGAMRYGKSLLKERFASFMIDSITMSLKKDAWATLKGTAKSTGKRTTNKIVDTISAAWNITSLNLTVALAGSTAQERLDNVHSVAALDPTGGQWVDVVVTAASGATPGVLTITAPGGTSTSTTYKVIYNQAETGSYAWCAFPSRISEPPLRCTDFSVNLGGKWDGSVITGGHAMQAELKGLDWTFNNGLTPEFTPGAGSGAYANRAFRTGRNQKVTLDRDFMDYIVGQRLEDTTDYFVFYAKAQGPLYETGQNYTVEIVFPRVGVLSADRSLDGSRLGEKGELVILEDDTYGSVVVNIKNKVATYAA